MHPNIVLSKSCCQRNGGDGMFVSPEGLKQTRFFASFSAMEKEESTSKLESFS